ncbi:MAG: NAD-dependent deacetylase [Blastocatellia bacterium]|jgi:NAD-dependent deacetylase|nr:NAD-dependent deacetylase [Blastocatellia bacterium]
MQQNHQVSIGAELRERFASAQSVLVLTGAGVSAESGVPTFRSGGQSAVWKGMPFEIISSGQMAQRDLRAVWEWFDYRLGLLRKLGPNPAHAALARWQDWFKGFTLVTQNVDGLHQAAGSRSVVELHGNIWRARCTACEARRERRVETKEELPPVCHECGEAMRPDVVLFGEMLPAGAFERAARMAAECDLCFVVGTSALVYPAASLPELAREAGAFVVEVNPEETPLSALCNESLRGKAGEVLPLFKAG